MISLHSVGGDYSTMTDILRNDPLALYTLLSSKYEEVQKTIKNIQASGQGVEHLPSLGEAVTEIERALTRVVARLNLEAEEEAARLSAAEEEIPDDAPAIEEESGSDDQFIAEDIAEEEATDDATLDEEGIDDPSLDEEASDSGEEEMSPSDAEPDDAAISDAILEEPKEEEEEGPENPVAMTTKLRRAMSDPAADIMDEYAKKVYDSVMTYFENLTKKALDLGKSDSTDNVNSLRETLSSEVGRRGLVSVESNFPEWRQMLMKKIWKDVAGMFEVPETEEETSSDFPVEMPATPDSAQPEAEPAAVAPSPVTPTEPEPEPMVAAVGPISFTLKADFRHAPRKSVTLI